MHVNTSNNKIKKPRGRPKKVKLDVQTADKLFPSHSNLEEIEIKTPIVISKSENPNKSYKNNENWTKRKCLCCGKIFDSWGIGNRLCKGCK